MVKNSFNFIRGFLLILVFLAVGKLISAYLPLPFPASIIGLILLFSSLSLGLVKVEWIQLTGHFILKYMALLFIPIGVGLINHFELIASHWFVILFSIFFTSLLIMLLVGHFFQFINKKGDS